MRNDLVYFVSIINILNHACCMVLKAYVNMKSIIRKEFSYRYGTGANLIRQHDIIIIFLIMMMLSLFNR